MNDINKEAALEVLSSAQVEEKLTRLMNSPTTSATTSAVMMATFLLLPMEPKSLFFDSMQ